MGLRNQLFRWYFPEFAAAIRRMPLSSGVVLMYHEVLPDDVTLPAWTIVRESDFRWQMNYLRMHFDVVCMNQALDRVSAKRPGGKPFAVVTFDDGYKGNLDTVLPIMESMGLPFILYVATKAVVDNSIYWYDRIINLLSVPEDVLVSLPLNGQDECFRIPGRAKENIRWREIQRLLDRLKQMEPHEREKTSRRIADKYAEIESPLGMLSPEDLRSIAGSKLATIGCHTHGHELLDQLEPQEIRDTINLACEHITYITGALPRHFAYPNGNLNELVIDLVQEAGFETAVTTVHGFWSRENNCLKIPRIGIGRFDTVGSFKARASGYM